MFSIAVLEVVVLTFLAAGTAAVLHGVIRGRFDHVTALLALAAVVFVPVLGSTLVVVLVIRDRLALRAGER